MSLGNDERRPRQGSESSSSSTPNVAHRPTSCQRVDTVHDAKTSISRELDVIRDRLGHPTPHEDIDRSDPTARRAFARAYVDTQQQAGRGRGIDPDTWEGSVDGHLEPAPASRLWLTRHNGRSVPLRPVVDQEEAAREAARKRAAAARAAWEHLNEVGYAGDGGHGDLVTEVLAADMPGPRPVVIVSRTVDEAGGVVERITQAELWDEDEYPGGDVA